MTDSMYEPIAEALEANLRELVTAGGLRPGNILVIGTSTSEILGHRIGTSGTLDAGAVARSAIWSRLRTFVSQMFGR